MEQWLVSYSQKLIDRFGKNDADNIHIVDRHGAIIASSHPESLGTKCPTALFALNDADGSAPVVFANGRLFDVIVPLVRNRQAEGFVVVSAAEEAQGKMLAQMAVAALEGVMSHEARQRKPAKRVSREELIVRELL